MLVASSVLIENLQCQAGKVPRPVVRDLQNDLFAIAEFLSELPGFFPQLREFFHVQIYKRLLSKAKLSHMITLSIVISYVFDYPRALHVVILSSVTMPFRNGWVRTSSLSVSRDQ